APTVVMVALLSLQVGAHPVDLRLALGCQLVVLARWTGIRLLPLVVDQPLAAQLAEEGIERAFLRFEFGLTQPAQHVGDIDLVARDDLQDEELEQSLPDRAELFLDAHGKAKATLC